jgi:hypothetical protein
MYEFREGGSLTSRRSYQNLQHKNLNTIIITKRHKGHWKSKWSWMVIEERERERERETYDILAKQRLECHSFKKITKNTRTGRKSASLFFRGCDHNFIVWFFVVVLILYFCYETFDIDLMNDNFVLLLQLIKLLIGNTFCWSECFIKITESTLKITWCNSKSKEGMSFFVKLKDRGKRLWYREDQTSEWRIVYDHMK